MTVLVGWVPKPEGDAAVEAAIAEARLRGEPLVVLNTSSGSAYADASWATDEQLEALRGRLDASGVPYDLRQTMAGREPADEVVELAEQCGASLLVIGLRRRTAVGKFLLGSSAASILMHAPCPVLAVKAAGGGRQP